MNKIRVHKEHCGKPENNCTKESKEGTKQIYLLLQCLTYDSMEEKNLPQFIKKIDFLLENKHEKTLHTLV